MEVETGYIKAVANLSNRYGTGYYEYYNYAIGEATEPGSTFKLPALMAAIEDGLIDIYDSVDTKNGKHRFHDRIMRDSNDKGYGKVTVETVFQKSSNVGISRVIYDAYHKNPQRFIDRLHGMGLGKKLGVSIAGEGAPLHAGEGPAVVDHPAAGLGHAVGGDAVGRPVGWGSGSTEDDGGEDRWVDAA